MKTFAQWLLLAMLTCASVPAQALDQDGGICPRPGEGEVVQPPPDIYSHNGVLKVHFNYHTSVDNEGRVLFCFVTDDGLENPTLHVNPGDKIEMTVTNLVPAVSTSPSEVVSSGQDVCGSPIMTLTSVNVHFHGTNTLPTCHSDEVIRTLINSGETFKYSIHFPKDEPPGMYWYHPHVHGISSQAVEGGACGAIVVEGIENIQQGVVGLPQRILILRDMPLIDQGAVITPTPPGPVPFWDLSLNYVPVIYPQYRPAIVKMHDGEKEFWRLVNASANSIFDIQITYDGVQQPLQIVAFDGVPTGSQDGQHSGTTVTQHDILLPPAGRVEFIVTSPTKAVKVAQLSTIAIDSGPLGDSLPGRPIADIELTQAPLGLRVGKHTGPENPQRFSGLDRVKPWITRHLYFSETFSHAQKGDAHSNGGAGVNFFITVKGQEPKKFDPNDPPAITTTQGAVEDWIIQNRAPEVHEFHIHQIHFLLLEINGVRVPKDQRQFYDTFQVPYWDQIGKYPSIKVRMDFRGPVVGDFVYHCHILQHEDGGMMEKIRVLPKT
ncbi:MAG TPA: multicopper oxidase domain-containing protein [Rhizomicrobium sp.]|nr:multicopper oxidase domain-containing protein [Rhizomicrobium sp.]